MREGSILTRKRVLIDEAHENMVIEYMTGEGNEERYSGRKRAKITKGGTEKVVDVTTMSRHGGHSDECFIQDMIEDQKNATGSLLRIEGWFLTRKEMKTMVEPSKSLYTMCAIGEKMIPKEGWFILNKIARVIEGLHNLSPPFVHTRLSPKDIVFTQEGQVKIIPRGLRKTGSWRRNVGMDKEDVHIRWRAIEIFAKDHDDIVKPKQDIYSYGTVAFWLITGNVPFPTLDEKCFYLAAKRGSREKIPEEVHPDWRKLILDCWKGPDERITIEEIVERTNKELIV